MKHNKGNVIFLVKYDIKCYIIIKKGKPNPTHYIIGKSFEYSMQMTDGKLPVSKLRNITNAKSMDTMDSMDRMPYNGLALAWLLHEFVPVHVSLVHV